MKTAIALGTFDGLHSGHRAVLERVIPHNSIAVTFSLPPKFYFSRQPELIMTPERKEKCLYELGVKRVEQLNFADFKNLSPQEFFDYLCRKYNPELISCGYNYRFGNGAAGDAELLKDLCQARGIELCCLKCVNENDTPISSTYIRSLLASGEIERANEIIYKGFCFSGEVIHGDSRGHTLGFPTANQLYPESLARLENGVYTSEIEIDGRLYRGISNIGLRPTFKTEQIASETFIKDFSGDIYGKSITVHPKKFLRPEQKFNSVEELKSAVLRDINSI